MGGETEEDKKRAENHRNILSAEKIDPVFFLLVGTAVLAGCFFFVSILVGEIALLVAGWIIAFIICFFESKIKITDLFVHLNKHKVLFFFTIVMSALIMYESGVIGGLLFLALAWGYNDKKNTKLINRVKNFKQHKIRFAFSVVIVLASATMMFLHFEEAKQQAFTKNYPEPVITVLSGREKQATDRQYKLEFSVKDYTDVEVNGEEIAPTNDLFSKVIDLSTLQTKIDIEAKNEHKTASMTFFIARDETDEEKQAREEAEEVIGEQKAVAVFLAEIGRLTSKAGGGNDEVTKMGMGLQSGGLTLPYAVSAQVIFESVLEEAKLLKVPPGGEKVKSYFLESVRYQLTGVENMRLGLESTPMNEGKMWQGLETYNKSMLSTARCTEEINKLRAKVGLE